MSIEEGRVRGPLIPFGAQPARPRSNSGVATHPAGGWGCEARLAGIGPRASGHLGRLCAFPPRLSQGPLTHPLRKFLDRAATGRYRALRLALGWLAAVSSAFWLPFSRAATRPRRRPWGEDSARVRTLWCAEFGRCHEREYPCPVRVAPHPPHHEAHHHDYDIRDDRGAAPPRAGLLCPIDSAGAGGEGVTSGAQAFPRAHLTRLGAQSGDCRSGVLERPLGRNAHRDGPWRLGRAHPGMGPRAFQGRDGPRACAPARRLPFFQIQNASERLSRLATLRGQRAGLEPAPAGFRTRRLRLGAKNKEPARSTRVRLGKPQEYAQATEGSAPAQVPSAR